MVAFDAPGNGDSPGTRTTALEYAAIVSMLSERYGGFESIVAHSLGVVATFMAVRDLGARAGRIAAIAGVHDFDDVFESFARRAGLPETVARRFRDRFVAWAEPVMGDPSQRLLSELPSDQQVPLLVVHDESDREVSPHQAERIVAAHPGARLMVTQGLGHARILRDPAVLDAVREFAAAQTELVEIA